MVREAFSAFNDIADFDCTPCNDVNASNSVMVQAGLSVDLIVEELLGHFVD